MARCGLESAALAGCKRHAWHLPKHSIWVVLGGGPRLCAQYDRSTASRVHVLSGLPKSVGGCMGTSLSSCPARMECTNPASVSTQGHLLLVCRQLELLTHQAMRACEACNACAIQYSVLCAFLYDAWVRFLRVSWAAILRAGGLRLPAGQDRVLVACASAGLQVGKAYGYHHPAGIASWHS